MNERYPTPEERADVVIMNLEKVIRESRESHNVGRLVHGARPKGMSFKKWQDAAREEIASAIRNSERVDSHNANLFNRFLMVCGACLASLGSMGIYVAWGKADKALVGAAGIVLGIVFIAMGSEWLVRRTIEDIMAERRARKLARIKDLDKQVKRLEAYLEDKRDFLKDELDKLR